MSWQVHRPGEGRISRSAALALAALGMGPFSAYRWWLWAEASSWKSWILPMIGMHQLAWSQVGAAVLLVGFALIGYRICFVREKTSAFLIEMERELRKVTWPEWKPLFNSKAELWGSTYVVIVVIAALALFVGVVDLALGYAHGVIFLR